MLPEHIPWWVWNIDAIAVAVAVIVAGIADIWVNR